MRFFTVLAGCLLSLLATASLAQTWPQKPVRVVVAFPPGGAADAIARALQPGLQTSLGQPVVIENRAGANGMVAAEAVAKSAADGYTILMASGGMVSVNPHLYAKLPIDPVKDLTPVAATARIAVFLVTNPKVPANNVAEFIAHVKANPGKLSFGSPGSGSSPHLAGEMFKAQAGLFALHVPYRGAAPALQDLLAGQLDFHFDPGVGLPQVKAGKLKLLAVGSPKRAAAYPDTPTLDEAGLKGFDADSIFGLYAPAGTPADVVARLNREVNQLLASAAVKERIATLGGEALTMSPAEFGARAADDSRRFGAIIKARKIAAD